MPKLESEGESFIVDTDNVLKICWCSVDYKIEKHRLYTRVTKKDVRFDPMFVFLFLPGKYQVQVPKFLKIET